MYGEEDQDGTDLRTLSQLQQKYRIDIWERTEKIRSTPGYEQVFLLDTASQLGVRMSRILDGEYTLTLDDSMTYKHFSDSIGISGAWTTMLYKGKQIRPEKRPLWQIPYRSLLPRKTANLLVAGRCFSFEEKLVEDTRIIGTCLVTGHGAGAAAAVAVAERTTAKEVDIGKGTVRTEKSKSLDWMKTQPRHIRNISFWAALLTALPIYTGVFTGFYLWLSPFIFLSSALALKTLTIFNIFGLAVLTAGFLNDRWFCRYLCPTGLLCDQASKFSVGKPGKPALPQISKGLAAATLFLSLLGLPFLAFLDPVNAFYNFFNILNPYFSTIFLLNISGLIFILLLNLVSPGSWCGRICPLGGLQMLLTDARKLLKKEHPPYSSFIPGRRQLLAGSIGAGFGLAFLHFSRRLLAAPLFRPPGSLPEDRLKLACIRCGSCIKACPTGIIKPSINSGDLTGLMTPELDFTLSYCLPECTACGDVCPSGAITAFSEKEKKQLFVGMVKIKLDQCLLKNNKECNQCKLACAYDAIEIKSFDNNFTAVPEVNTSLCVGCAACKIACPPGAIVITAPLSNPS